jgi:hypothetical protein
VNATTIGAEEIVLTTPIGPIPPARITVTRVEAALFDVSFPPQSAPGQYQLQVGPHVATLFGLEMDQNGNGTPGEVPGDIYSGTFDIAQPTIAGTVRATNGWLLKNVTVRAADGSASTATDVNGNYTLAVAPGWGGNVLPDLTGGAFTPASRAYLSLSGNQTGQDFTLTTALQPHLSIARHGASVNLSWPSLACFAYQLRSSVDLTNWTDVGAAQPGNGATLNVSVSGTNALRLFRVQVNN